MKRTLQAGSPRRAGFTLIELLTVITIVAVLMGLSLGAYFRVKKSQEEGATRTTISKLQSQLDTQMRAVLDNCRDDARNSRIPTGVMSLANADNRRATVIWTKMKLKQEFPQNFFEALRWPLAAGLAPKSAYKTAFPAAYVPTDPTTLPDDRLHAESAVMLYLSLLQTRRGNTGFDPQQHIGAHAIGEVEFPDIPGVKYKVFKDSWDQPIGFIRWPFGGGNSDLNTPPHSQTDNAGRPIDPQDPERTLLGNDWYSVAPGSFKVQFEQTLFHPVNPVPLNLSPVIVSAGRDKGLGFSMQPAIAFQYIDSRDDDNVYGYRMKGEGRRE